MQSRVMMIGIVALAAGCAGLQPRLGGDGVAGRWQGHSLRNGLRTPLAVELTRSGEGWQGFLSAGDNFIPLERVRVTPTGVHFEVAGDVVFDGSIAGEAMAGSILGASSGSFALERRAAVGSGQDDPYGLGP